MVFVIEPVIREVPAILAMTQGVICTVNGTSTVADQLLLVDLRMKFVVPTASVAVARAII